MKFSPQLLFIFFVQTCSVYSKAFSVPCDNSFNVTSDADNYRSLLQSEDSIIYDLTNVVTEADIDFDLSRCRQELMVIKEGIRKKDAWTFKLVDASAKPSSGFVSGNNFWFGSAHQCKTIVDGNVDVKISNRYKRNMKQNLLTDAAPFDVEMRFAYVKHSSSMQADLKIMSENVLHLGLCLPKSCSNRQIQLLVEKLLNQKKQQNAFGMKTKVVEVKDLKFNPRFLLRKSFLALIAYFVFAKIIRRIASKQKDRRKLDDNNNAVSCTEHVKPLTFLEKFTKCFDYDENKKSIRDRTPQALGINSISGLRSISCYLIMISHIFTFSHFVLLNKISFLVSGETLPGNIMTNSALLVDGFFVISGFLAASSLLRDSKRSHEIKVNGVLANARLYGQMLTVRYIRLTPTFLLSMFLSAAVSSLLNDVSVYQIFDRNDLKCSQFGWRNIFYVSNFYSLNDMCVGWSWSLACDMQFFAVTTLFLMIYVKNPRVGVKLLIGSIASLTVASLFNHVYHDFSLKFDVLSELLSVVYIPPWARMAPYIMGTLTAIYLHENGGFCKISEKAQSRLWLTCWVILAGILLGQCFKDASAVVSSCMKVFAHTNVAFVFCWTIMADASGYRNAFIRFLSKGFFIRYGKTTYAAYLIAPIVTTFVYGLTSNGSDSNVLESVIMSHVIVELTHRISYLATVYVDVPFCNLSKLIFQKPSASSKMK